MRLCAHFFCIIEKKIVTLQRNNVDNLILQYYEDFYTGAEYARVAYP